MRPRKDPAERRTRAIAVRLTASERAALEAAAAARGVTPTAYVRSAFQAAQGAPARQTRPIPALDASLVSALNRIGANLNQLARRANSGDLLQPGELPDALARIDQQLARIEILVFAAIDS